MYKHAHFKFFFFIEMVCNSLNLLPLFPKLLCPNMMTIS